ncbi:hypothetical protein MWU60_15205 [Yoonia sp. F2084L]|uniref:hypothetical protein n=1 Tax=Yoonia sp. F2084L TaxID=2926419 RepID=UPI001FF33C6E|nr:hypothetical protein [Yoonia sp. F2084L]MCK0096925.1 hypothetical protein [Yoonia sp. F2084L]
MRKLSIGLILLASASIAQSASQVTLKYDDGTGVSGELVGFDDGIFRIQASVGLIAIPAQDVSCIGAVCPEGTELQVAAAPVVLTSLDGNLRIAGDVIEFVDGEYVLATEIGEFRIDASLIVCEGEGCVPSSAPANEEPVSQEVFLVNGTTSIEGKLLGLEDGAYLIEVDQLGTLRVDANTFDCRGEACP